MTGQANWRELPAARLCGERATTDAVSAALRQLAELE